MTSVSLFHFLNIISKTGTQRWKGLNVVSLHTQMYSLQHL